jgi:ribosomal protein L17
MATFQDMLIAQSKAHANMINQKVSNQSITSTMPKNEAQFKLTKVANGHILEMQGPNGRYVRIIPEGENIGDHVTMALVEAKLEK